VGKLEEAKRELDALTNGLAEWQAKWTPTVAEIPNALYGATVMRGESIPDRFSRMTTELLEEDNWERRRELREDLRAELDALIGKLARG
jgi:hypothetical protein